MELMNLTANDFELMEEAELSMIHGGTIRNGSYRESREDNFFESDQRPATPKRQML
jgi:hypothetical protein